MSKQQVVAMPFSQIKRINLSAVSSYLGNAALPILGMVIFLGLWNVLAKNVDTSLGQFPGPAAGWEQANVLFDEHQAQSAKAEVFYERQEKRNVQRMLKEPSYQPKNKSVYRCTHIFRANMDQSIHGHRGVFHRLNLGGTHWYTLWLKSICLHGNKSHYPAV
jgi:hypothetical protein